MIAIYKKPGETPLEALGRLRESMEVYAHEKLSYAGRLDPLAEGVMIVLSGNDVVQKDNFLGLDKTYTTEILFGISTDTGDVLGKIIDSKECVIERKEVEEKIKHLTGKQIQAYPAYSSKSFKGAFEDVRDGNIVNHEHEVEIYSIKLLDMYTRESDEVLRDVQKRIGQVRGDFRQKEIGELWNKNLYDISYKLCIAHIELSVSSGFYVRQFAIDLGQAFDVPALAYSIIRTQVGEYTQKDCVL